MAVGARGHLRKRKCTCMHGLSRTEPVSAYHKRHWQRSRRQHWERAWRARKVARGRGGTGTSTSVQVLPVVPVTVVPGRYICAVYMHAECVYRMLSRRRRGVGIHLDFSMALPKGVRNPATRRGQTKLTKLTAESAKNPPVLASGIRVKFACRPRACGRALPPASSTQANPTLCSRPGLVSM